MVSIWKSESQVNTTDTEFAIEQFDSQVVGLVGGNYVVVWTHDTSSDDNSFLEIRGRVFNYLGVPLGNDFIISSLNPGNSASSVTALPNGGFAVAYQDRFFSDETDHDVRVHIFNSSGAFQSAKIVDSSSDDETNPVVQSFNDNSYVLFYEDDVGGDGNHNLVFKTVSSTGTVGAQTSINSETDEQENPDAARLSNGNVVVVYEDEFSGGQDDVEFAIVGPTGTIVKAATVAAGSSTLEEFEPTVAALRDGGFVIAWTTDVVGAPGIGSQDVKYEVYDNAGNRISGNDLQAATDLFDDQNEPQVVALNDGGFLIIWDSDAGEEFRGQQFNAAGGKVGPEFDFSTGTLGNFQPRVGTTSDGRVVYSYSAFHSGGQDILYGILDPRGPVIDGTS
jgi:hypothetical protein